MEGAEGFPVSHRAAEPPLGQEWGSLVITVRKLKLATFPQNHSNGKTPDATESAKAAMRSAYSAGPSKTLQTQRKRRSEQVQSHLPGGAQSGLG